MKTGEKNTESGLYSATGNYSYNVRDSFLNAEDEAMASGDRLWDLTKAVIIRIELSYISTFKTFVRLIPVAILTVR